MSKLLSALSSVSDTHQNTVKNIFQTMAFDDAEENMKCGTNWLTQFETDLGCVLDVFNPMTVAVNKAKISIPSKGPCTVGVVSNDILKQTVEASVKAKGPWGLLSGHERAKYLYRIAKKVQEQSYLFAVLESWGTGKPIIRIKNQDVPNMIRSLYHFAGWAELWKTEMPDWEPFGIIAVMPNQFNDPLMSICWHVGAALATGNCVILLPHVTSCLSAGLFAELCRSSGLPADVFNVLPFYDSNCVELLQSACNAKVDLDCGLKVCCGYESLSVWENVTGPHLDSRFLNVDLDFNHSFSPSVIILDDADLNSAVLGVLQCCTFFSRCENYCQILVQDAIKENFLDEFISKFKDSKDGYGLEIADTVPVGRELKINHVEEKENGAMVMYVVSSSPDMCQLISINDIPTDEKNCGEENLKTLNILFFRTAKEAVEMFNNRKTGRGVCIWSEKMSACLEVAHKVKSGTVWINCQNEFDPVVGYGGAFLSSGIREGGKFSLMQFVKPRGSPVVIPKVENFQSCGLKLLPKKFRVERDKFRVEKDEHTDFQLFDEIFKSYYGGTFKLPDGNNLIPVTDCGNVIGHITEGTGKDIFSAVESAKAAQLKWENQSGFDKAQMLYSIAENLEAQKEEFSYLLSLDSKPEIDMSKFEEEVEIAVQRIFYWAAHADKYGGVVQETQVYGKVMETFEPLGVIGILCPEDFRLLSFISLLIPAIVLGNTVVVIPSENYPFPALKMCEIFEAANVPAGVINVISGHSEFLTRHLALHSEIESLWLHKDIPSVAAYVQQKAVIMNKKRVWRSGIRDWKSAKDGQGIEFIYHSTYNKTIWLPMGNML